MLRDPTRPSEAELQLDEILVSYMEAEEAGRPLNPQQLLCHHPELAPQLAQFFANQDQFDRLAAPLRAVAQAALPATPRPGITSPAQRKDSCAVDRLPEERLPALGDYQLLEKLGQGGMGIVYKARQKKLNRLVALKVVRTDLLSEVDIQRFRNEAEIVAHLDHAHIVPIYEVGELDSRLYFSMKLIEGGSLTERVVRTSESRVDKQVCRRAVQIVATVARAVHHAHQRGILHRDLKPSNILLAVRGDRLNAAESDSVDEAEPYEPFVTDFGLAKRVEMDSSLTESRTLVGTPSYMSPEQTTGKKGAITTATDVYGLGAVLYALLTGRPPFRGETVLDTLSYVRECEPEPPHRSNRCVNRDLETICLKCLEKEPKRRYGSAEALAQDLERWLIGEPIQARAVNRWERLWRWCRRNPKMATLTTLIALLVLVVAAGSTASTFLIGRQMAQTEMEKRRAQENLRTAYQVLDEIYVEFAEKRLPRERELTSPDRLILERTLRFYEQFASQNSMDLTVRGKTTEAYLRVGALQETLGQVAKAVTAYEQALAVSVKLAGEFPNLPEIRYNLARSYAMLGGLHGDLAAGRRPQVEQAYAEALRIQEELVRDFPANLDYRRDLAITNFRLSRFWGAGTFHPGAGAEGYLLRALAIQEQLVRENPTSFNYRQERGESLGNLGGILALAGRYQEAERVFGRNLELRQKLVDDFPAEHEARHFLADAYMDVGRLRFFTGEFLAAEQAYRRELTLRQQLAAEFPSVSIYQFQLAVCNANFRTVVHRKGALEEVLTAQGRVGMYCLQLTAQFLQVPQDAALTDQLAELLGEAVRYSADDPAAENALAWFLATCSQPRFRDPKRAAEMAQRLVEQEPQKGAYWRTLGAALYGVEDWQGAFAALEKALELPSGGDGTERFLIAMAFWHLGNQEAARTCYEQAVQWMEQNQPEDPQELLHFGAEAASLLGIEAPAKQEGSN